MTKVFIVRHGETELNEKKATQGAVADSKLTEKGKKQVEGLTKRLIKENIDVVYCSDSGRCKETIKPFISETKTPITYHKELGERNFGIFEGKPFSKFLEYVRSECPEDSYSVVPAGGEAISSVQDRMMRKFEEIRKKKKEKKVLVVTSGGAISSFLIKLFGEVVNDENYCKYSMDNAAITTIEVSDESKPLLKELNSIEHLEE